METLLKYRDHIFNIKDRVEKNDTTLYSHICIENGIINNETISIVMTAANRSKQTYFTLKTMENSINKNIQVIIVDDSDCDQIDASILSIYPFTIDLIKINRENKCWHNPLVNYNIGFKFIKGCKVVIQNAEVCHIGDVLEFIKHKVVEDDKYYVFDVKSSASYEANEEIYRSDTNSIEIYNKNIYDLWYNHGKHRTKNYHFLTALNKATFDKINNFGYDCTMSSCYDDDELLIKIISKKISILNVINEESNVGGLHLYHGKAPNTWDNGVEMNEMLFVCKKRIYEKFGIYCDATENKDDFNKKYENLQYQLNNLHS
jgi:hypothetical protein